MSIEVLFAVTKPAVIRKACRGWAPALAEPRPLGPGRRARKSWVPEGFEPADQRATTDQVLGALKKARPLALTFTLVGKARAVLDDLRPAFLTNEDGLEYSVSILTEDQVEFLARCGLAPVLGRLADRKVRASGKLSAYLYVFSF